MYVVTRCHTSTITRPDGRVRCLWPLLPLLPLPLLPLLLLLWLVSGPVRAEAVGWQYQGQHWFSLQSEHFVVNYPSGLEDIAHRTVQIAEQTHTELSAWFGSQPEHPTQVVLVDDFDAANGWATPLPFAQMRLYISPPDQVSGLEHYDDWLSLLIRHEYTHVLHTDLQRGAVRQSRNLFGRMWFSFPHALEPSLLLEGLAVYLESNKDLGSGRLNSTFYRMQMQAELEQQPDSLGQVLVPPRDWPYNKAYLYGAWFVRYLAQQYSEQQLKYFLWLHSGRLLPYSELSGDFRRSFGLSLEQLWQGFLTAQAADWQPQRQQRLAQSWQGEPLPGNDLVTERRPMASNGSWLAAVEYSGESARQLVSYQSAGTGWERVQHGSVKGASSVDIGQDGRLVYSRPVTAVDGRVWNDVFYRQKNGREVRISQGLRARQVRWLNTGQLLVRRMVAGRAELLTLDLHGNRQLLWRGDYGVVIGDVDLSPDRTRLVAAVKRPRQGWNLALYSLASATWQLLTNTSATENAPVFRDNQTLLFSADYEANFDIYQLSLTDQQLTRWTRVTTGAFEPQWLADRLVYQRYSAEGYRLYEVQEPLTASATGLPDNRQLAEYRQADTRPITAIIQAHPAAATLDQTSPISAQAAAPADQYQPWHDLRPRSWFPLWYVDEFHTELGVTTWGQDALGRHNYSVNLLRDVTYGVTSGALLYSYDNRYGLYLSREYRYAQGAEDNERDQLGREDQLIAQRNYLLHGFEDRFALHLGTVWESKQVIDNAGLPWRGGQWSQGLVGLAATWNNRQSFRQVPGVGQGSYADLVIESNDVLNSQYRGALAQFRGRYTLDLPGRDTLTLGLDGGIAADTGEYFALGGQTGDEAQLFGRDQIALPGYHAGVRYGHRYHKESLSSRLWLGRLEQNWSTWPIGFGDYFTRVYAVAGGVEEDGQFSRWLPALGGELTLQLWWGYSTPGSLTIGYSQGLDNASSNGGEGYLQLVWPLGG